MRIHLYDNLNRNKKATVGRESFTYMVINHTIDDFSTANLSFGISEAVIEAYIAPFDNIYVEDDDGNIIFGGQIVGYNNSPRQATLNCIDHRWILSRLVLDTALTLTSTDDVLDTVEQLMNQAKAKRAIPVDFDREGSAFNTALRADLKFEVGENIAACLQKIIQSTYSRWAVRYTKNGNDIAGKLVVRSVLGVTPQGVGIARGKGITEDGEQVTLIYEEGNQKNNIQDFIFNIDLSEYNSWTKMGAKLGGDVSTIIDVPPSGFSQTLDSLFGRTEIYVSDYNVNSTATAIATGRINQNFIRQDFDVTLAPDYTRLLNCGDRVNIEVVTPLFSTKGFNLVARIDSLSYTIKDGYYERRLLVNTMSPQKRMGTIGLLTAISDVQQQLRRLDKNYFNN